MIDLKSNAKNLIADLINDLVVSQKSEFNIVILRDAVSEAAHQSADDACIYYQNAVEIINRYEIDPRADTDSADEMGTTFKPSQYREAMQAYAYYIARSIIEAEASALIDELEEARDTLDSIINDAGDRRMPVEEVPTTAFRLSADCPHGWAAHNYETNAGACFWVSRQLDGCNAVAIPAAGVWLSYTWE